MNPLQPPKSFWRNKINNPSIKSQNQTSHCVWPKLSPVCKPSCKPSDALSFLCTWFSTVFSSRERSGRKASTTVTQSSAKKARIRMGTSEMANRLSMPNDKRLIQNALQAQIDREPKVKAKKVSSSTRPLLTNHLQNDINLLKTNGQVGRLLLLDLPPAQKVKHINKSNSIPTRPFKRTTGLKNHQKFA